MYKNYYSREKKLIMMEEEIREENVLYDNLTQEELYQGLVNGELPEEAFAELFRRLRPLTIYMARNYMSLMRMDEEDMCQEAMILLWTIIMKHSYMPGRAKFSSFFFQCWENKLRYKWRGFVMKNPLPVQHQWDRHGRESQGETVVYWSDAVERYKEKNRIRAARYLQRIKEQKNGTEEAA